MKEGDMVKHIADPQRSRGLVTTITSSGGLLVQWGNGDLIRYEGNERMQLVSLGWNLYAR